MVVVERGERISTCPIMSGKLDFVAGERQAQAFWGEGSGAGIELSVVWSCVVSYEGIGGWLFLLW